MFINHVGNIRVDKISDFEITDYLNTYERKKHWTGVTYNYAKISLNNLFKFLVVNKYISSNQTTLLERRKEIKTEIHQVFTDDDFILIMHWLRMHDPYCLLFIQMIYYTCTRPKELRYTQLNKMELDKYQMHLKPSPYNFNKGSKASIAFYVAMQFKTVLTLESDFGVRIFKDYMQRVSLYPITNLTLQKRLALSRGVATRIILMLLLLPPSLSSQGWLAKQESCLHASDNIPGLILILN